MLTFNQNLSNQFKKLVDERISALKDEMAAGFLSLEDYKKSSGRIQGLIEAIALVDEANSICEGK